MSRKFFLLYYHKGWAGVKDKRSVKQKINRLRRLKTWQLVVILVFMILMSATFLRLNNIGMVQRQKAVEQADKQGDMQAVQDRLYDLRRYVSDHMNTSGARIYLHEKYNRDKAELIKKAVENNNANKDVINKKVDDICKPQFSGYNQGYVSCFAREYAKYAPGTDPISSVKVPDIELYRYDFVSVVWSPDFAGFSILICIVIIMVIIARLVSLVVLRIILKFKYRDI